MLPAVEQNQVRIHHLVTGYNFQIGDWVWIHNPREGKPHNGEIIGVTRDQLVKVEGTIHKDGQDIVVIVRQAPKNITLANTSLL